MNIILGIILIIGFVSALFLITGLAFSFVDEQIFNGRLSGYATKWIDKKLGDKGDE